VEKNISGYGDSRFKIYLSSGPCYPPIQITVGRFRTKDWCDPSFSAVKKIVPVGTSKKLRIDEFYSPPFGITDFNQDLDGKFNQDLENKLMNHIQNIAKGKRNYGEVLYGNTSELTWDVYEAVRCYQCANPTVISSFLPFFPCLLAKFSTRINCSERR
jgi:hypothetical protein